ncbi:MULTISPECIES: hypothetical protein [Mesoflavibacter]|uniref:Lipocalin-like domain-containing protein n=1 Tax=Mesoflavibacter profundi TaxID=2708110 RepID=A0ABT4S2L5_9FLAO|nr:MULTISPECIES: hypothetical protein [Mesoflavibacter]MDA0178235.1 hypothetical protein [Mesoflavibacter profundi]QIJ89197.1 hypothetical protein C7H62_1388 [Mesoflavibacter sp. HG96]QIJ91925.1 hypothetical protein C7H56_1388 [Mesoflavibacter sp. HG37]
MKTLLNNSKHILGSLLLTTLLFSSCKTTDDNDLPPVEHIPATEQEFKSIKDEALADLTQNFSFNSDDGYITLTSENGVQIGINGDCLTLNGDEISGNVDIEFVEIFEKGNMLTTNKPTMGRLPNGDKAMLLTGGEFFIEATKDGQLLDTNCLINLIVPSSLTGGTDNEMVLWTGTIEEDDTLTWDEVDNATGQGGVFAEGGQYYTLLEGFGWTNVDRFYNDPRPKTQIQVQAPVGYNYTNSAVYLSYDGEDTGLAALDTYDGTLNLFSEHYGQIPIGLECHVIFATEDNGIWRYAVKAVTIAENDIITFNIDETTTGTKASLTALINALP